jgi:hypothetical protein
MVGNTDDPVTHDHHLIRRTGPFESGHPDDGVLGRMARAAQGHRERRIEIWRARLASSGEVVPIEWSLPATVRAHDPAHAARPDS